MSKVKYKVILVRPGIDKVAMMKAVRAIDPARFTGLKRAKDFIDSSPGVVVSGVTLEEAVEAVSMLEQAGAIAKMEPVISG